MRWAPAVARFGDIGDVEAGQGFRLRGRVAWVRFNYWCSVNRVPVIWWPKLLDGTHKPGGS